PLDASRAARRTQSGHDLLAKAPVWLSIRRPFGGGPGGGYDSVASPGIRRMPEFHLTPEQVFLYANYGVLPFWALLIFVPTLKITDIIVHSVLAPLLLGT